MFKNNSLPVRKKNKNKQQEIINLQGLIVFCLSASCLSFFIKWHSKILGNLVSFYQTPQLLSLLLPLLCYLLINWTNWTHIFFSCIIKGPHIFVNIWFRLVFKHSVAETHKSSVLRKEKMHKTEATGWHSELKPTKNELKMNILPISTLFKSISL